jgi:para-nitrobenzyl esterase
MISTTTGKVWMALTVGLVVSLGCSGATPSPGALSRSPGAVVSESLRHPLAGDVIGSEGLYGGFTWRGIPYARPPIGERRFRAPVPASRWEQTFKALRFASPCPQYASSTNTDAAFSKGDIIGEEDCLFLNIYAPNGSRMADASKAHGLPVMFWIHGGGNTSGTSSFYNGSRLADEHQVVVVTINYRLGFLGWFRHRALRAGADAADASGNFGILDQILALEWVQENIAAFGGDPANVTIFGESAGAWNVLALMASPLAEGKFHRAIAESPLTWSFSSSAAENFADAAEPGLASSSNEVLVRLLLARGVATDRMSAKNEIAAMDDETLSQFLREQTVAELFEGYRREGTEVADGYFCPRIFEDGFVLPSHPLGHAFRPEASFNRVPVILGTNKDEEKLFLLYNREYTSQLFGIIPTFRDRGRYLRDAETITRIWRMMAVDEIAQDLSRSMSGTVFSYRFDWDEQPSFLWSNLSELIGAAHGFEIPFVFGHWDLGPSSNWLFAEGNREGRESLSRAMRSYWAEFAWRGSPGTGRRGDLPEWPHWDLSQPRFAILDTPAGGGIRMSTGRDTATEIAQTILEDTSYESLERRCHALASIYNWAPLAFSVDDFTGVGEGLCRGFSIHDLIEPL